MATQWNYDFSPGEVLTASVMDSLGATWETFTPNFRPGAGVWFAATTFTSTYARIGKIIIGQAGINITSSGTATGTVRFDLPVTSLRGNPFAIGSGREANLTGNTFNVFTTSTTLAEIRFFNNGETSAGNWAYAFFFMYEAA